ncbi:MAG TPA: PBP1A family penicillin-binding protein [Alphaproteobacteria bacterium]|nr:PBP1A family penicillin-binding protein [Alphaproteobacteria bacterium]
MANRRSSLKRRRAVARARRRRAAASRPSYQFHGEAQGPAAARKKAGGSASRKANLKRWREAAGLAARITAVAAAVMVFLLLVFFAQLTQGLPSTNELLAVNQEPSLTIVDAYGEKIGTRGLTQGAYVRLADMSPSLPLAVMAVEDRHFYHHWGLDFVGLARAAFANLREGHVVQGGSTITQQLAKILFLSPERTYKRKLQEAMLALWLEHELTKDQILETYLNRVYLGAGTYGVEAAAERYFGKSARDLSLVESAMIAGLLKAPSKYSPTNSLEEASQRTGLVLDLMVDAKFITPRERALAESHPAHIVAESASPAADYLLDWVATRLADYTGKPTQDVIVQTSFDMRLQRAAEQALTSVLDKEGARHHATEGAIVAMTPDGAVTAMVGGRSYQHSPFNRATEARRPPGSAFKPFVYLTAIQSGYRPENIVVDEPYRIGNWQPQNYTGRYLGPIALEDAFAQSINTVAARLGEAVGRERIIRVARSFGISSPLQPVPSLALGSEGVGVMELTGAYAPFANGGDAVIPHAIVRVLTKDGKPIYDRHGEGPGPVADPQSIGLMNEMLERVVEIGTGRGAHIPGQITGGKTGTGQDHRDAWFVGFTTHMIAGVWIGNDDFSPMKDVSGGNLPAEVFRKFMIVANQGLPMEQLPGVLLVQEEAPPMPPEGLSASAEPNGPRQSPYYSDPDDDGGPIVALFRGIGRIFGN